MVRLDFCLGACPEELLDTLVPEALYHPYSVYYRYTYRQQAPQSGLSRSLEVPMKGPAWKHLAPG